MPTTQRTQRRRQPVRSTQARRPSGPPQRPIEPPDYTRDYADVRRDLRLIAIISSVLFVGMIALTFVI
ncbi:MAG TPA: hypothetical protein PKD53_00265 [Chloroflexaceae bacterium]|nr:hypothetical protein [Chloroflexaceae bacterium]